MALLETPEAQKDWQAAPFSLQATDGKTYTLENARGPNELLVMFICNHCPYVQRELEGIVHDSRALQELGIGVIAISANDTHEYPEDNFDNMKKLAKQKLFSFPYAIDETQEVAKAYGAVCTPDYFGFNKDLKLQFRGRLQSGGTRELYEAMKEIAETGKSTQPQHPSMGCSIKWRQGKRAAS